MEIPFIHMLAMLCFAFKSGFPIWFLAPRPGWTISILLIFILLHGFASPFVIFLSPTPSTSSVAPLGAAPPAAGNCPGSRTARKLQPHLATRRGPSRATFLLRLPPQTACEKPAIDKNKTGNKIVSMGEIVPQKCGRLAA